MKRLSLGALLLLASFGSAQVKGPLPPKNEFYPLEVGARWTYVVPLGKDAAKKGEKDVTKDISVYVERMEPVRRQKRGVNLSEFLDSFIVKTESKSGSASDESSGDGRKGKLGIVMVLAEQLLVTEEGVFRMQCAGKDIEPFVKILGSPGDQLWNVASMSETVPLKGTFTSAKRIAKLDTDREVLIVSCRELQVGNRAMSADYWFAKGIGIVKQRVTVSEFGKSMDDEKKRVILDEFTVLTHLKEFRAPDKTIVQMPAKDALDRELPIPEVKPAPPPLPAVEKK